MINIRLVGHVARMSDRRVTYRVLVWRHVRKRFHLEDRSVDGKIKIKWIYRKWDGGHGLD
jgi:hypothetical protein